MGDVPHVYRELNDNVLQGDLHEIQLTGEQQRFSDWHCRLTT